MLTYFKNIHKYSAVVLLILIVSSCGSSKKVTTKKSTPKSIEHSPKETPKPDQNVTKTPPYTPEVYPTSTEEYIAIYSDIAQEEMRKYGIPASITLAQGILESGSGQGHLAREGNNHFGIKCHDWTGEKMYHDDDASQECFRKYANALYSFEDHSKFLTARERYSKLFLLKPDDYKAWAKELKAAGYATDKKYPRKLIALIERYHLARFDMEVLGKSYTNSDKHIVKKGDTLYKIARKYKLTVKELQELNGLGNTTIFIGQTLYIKPLPKDY